MNCQVITVESLVHSCREAKRIRKKLEDALKQRIVLKNLFGPPIRLDSSDFISLLLKSAAEEG